MEEKTSGNAGIPRMDLKEIISLNVQLMRGFGNYLPENKSTLKTILSITYAVLFVGTIFVCAVISETTNMLMALGNMETVTDASFLTLTHLVQVVKLYYLYKYQNRIKVLIKSINRKEFQPRSTAQYNILKDYIAHSKFITKAFLAACVMTCLFLALYPFTAGGELFLPLAGWFPFDTSVSPAFEIAYIYQVIASSTNGLSNITVDTFMSGLIMVICAQLNILKDSLLNIRLFAESDLRGRGKEVGEYMTRELQKRMNEILIECVNHHWCIIEFANEVSQLFTVSFLGQFVVSVVIICITLFEITLIPVLSIKFFFLILYQCCMLVEIFLMCYYGNEVIGESAELTKVAYCSDWIDCSMEFKRNLVFFMTRSQTALKLYAGGFFLLSLDTFVKIVKSSWSYFAVLNSMNSKK